MRRIRILVTGAVQGVGFRYTTRAEAERIGVTGWVRNLASGRVEAHVQGNERSVDEMRDWLRHGPPYANVERIDVTDVELVEGEEGFRILASG